MNHAGGTVAARLGNKALPTRLTIVLLFFFSSFLCYMDRINISVTILQMEDEFGWTAAQKGMVLSSFFWGYLLTQLPGGWLADRFGAKAVLGLGVVWWSFFTLLTPLTAASLTTLFLARASMGLGEGLNFPAIHSLTARWIPIQERSRAIAFNYTGLLLGTVVGLLLTPFLMVHFGWRSVFYSFGILGFLWYILWHRLAANRPEDHPTISSEELLYIQQHRPDAARAEKVPWRLIFSKAPVWALIAAHFCNNLGGYFVVTWVPTYLNKELGVAPNAIGYYAMLPWVAAFLVGNVSGWLADTLIARGLSVTATRKIFQSIAFTGASIFLLLLIGVKSAGLAMTYMTLSFVCGAFGLAAFGVNHLDIGPRYAGVLMGITNTAATIPGIFGPLAVGYILSATGSWTGVFVMIAAVNMFGLLIWNVFATGERVLT
jgi:ACS family sodium-dependent inorganic phosphate cotransporter